MYYIFGNEFLDSNFNGTVIDNISIFHDIEPNFTYSQYFIILKVLLEENRATASTL